MLETIERWERTMQFDLTNKPNFKNELQIWFKVNSSRLRFFRLRQNLSQK